MVIPPVSLFCAQLYRVGRQETAIANWETSTEVRLACEAAGYPVSTHQLRRWRGRGLLPEVRQSGRGRSTGGSDTRHPIGTAKQAIAIQQLLQKKEKLAGLGWALWMQGYPVREEHWREPLEAAQASLLEFQQRVRMVVNREERRTGESVFDDIDITILDGTPIYSVIARLPTAYRNIAMRVAADILVGKFRTKGASGKPNDPFESPAIEAALGLNGVTQNILGHSLDFGEIEVILESLSLALRTMSRNSNNLFEPSLRVRHDLLNTQVIAVNLYQSNEWLFKNGFKIRLIERIFRKSVLPIQALMLLVWRHTFADNLLIKNSLEITEMVRDASALLALSERLQAAITTLPEGHPLANKTKLRRAASGPRKCANFR